MSGGYFEYENNKMFEWSDMIKREHLQKDRDDYWKIDYTEEHKELMKEFSELVEKVGKLLHSFDYAMCGDTNMNNFNKDFNKFKEEQNGRIL